MGNPVNNRMTVARAVRQVYGTVYKARTFSYMRSRATGSVTHTYLSELTGCYCQRLDLNNIRAGEII